MGASMMDFMMREASFVLPGPVAVIRLGTCGLFNRDLPPGTVLTAGKGAMYIYMNYCYFNGACNSDGNKETEFSPFSLTKPINCDRQLNDLLKRNLKTANIPTFDGLCASAESFYR